MSAISAAAARARLHRIIDQVNDESEPLTITGRRASRPRRRGRLARHSGDAPPRLGPGARGAEDVGGCGRRAVVGLGVLAGAALALGGCAPLPGPGRRESTRTREQDGRFAEFTEYVPEELEIRTDLEPLEKRMPGIRFSSAHWVAQYQQQERELLPAPDRPIWIHVVATLEPDGARALAEASTGAADPLPGIHPDLRQYVAEADAFTAVPAERADGILDVEHMIQDDPNAHRHYLKTREAVICADSSTMILIALEYPT